MKKKIMILLLIICCICFCDNVMAFQCSAISDVQIDDQLAKIVRYVIIIMQICVPILLVVMGMIDLFKGIMAQKEDEIKKGQQIFIKRLIAGVLVFFVIAIVKFLVSLLAKGDNASIMNCASCFIEGPNSKNCKEA